MNSIRPAFATALAAAALLGGCGSGATTEPPLAGARIGGPFALVNQDGKPVRDVDFAGKYRIVYFGYTYCPDVCPTDMQKIGQAMRKLDASDPRVSAQVVPIFISVDPARDTPAVLKQFVSAFHPRMVGLTGDPKEIARVAKEYAVYYHAEPAGPGGGYVIGHSEVAYLMDPQGRPIAPLPIDKGPDAVAAEIERWVK
ncbi:MAG: SCO family protein [Sphingomonas sp.]